MLEVLIVEDQRGPLGVLKFAIDEVFQEYFGENYKISVVRSYNEAKELIDGNEFDIIFLDHRLPRENQGDLEDRDFDAFSDTLENIGYNLISLIKKKYPHCGVIGTSSMKAESLRCGTPDFIIDNKIDREETERQINDILIGRRKRCIID